MSNPKHLFQRGRRLILLVSLIAAVIILSGCGAQAAPKTYRVGILSGLDFFADTADGFKAKMTDLGYKEGQNIVYDVQQSNIDPAKYQQILQKFVADKVDLIFVFPTEAALEAKAATQGTDIPVVFANTALEGVNLVESVREPGGNITGARLPGPEQSAKRLEILHELMPQAKRVWVTYLQNYPAVPAVLEALHPTASSLGITLVEVPANSPADVQADLQARAQSADLGLDAILLLSEPLGVSPDGFAIISKFAAEHNVPVGGGFVFEGDQGGVFDNTLDYIEVGRSAASLADKIFKGTPAGTIPVVSPEIHLVINYKVAQKLGLTVPEGLLSRADKIIR